PIVREEERPDGREFAAEQSEPGFVPEQDDGYQADSEDEPDTDTDTDADEVGTITRDSGDPRVQPPVNSGPAAPTPTTAARRSSEEPAAPAAEPTESAKSAPPTAETATRQPAGSERLDEHAPGVARRTE